MNWLGIDESLLQSETINPPEYRPIEAGVYEVTVDKAYLRTTDSGATMLELDLVEVDPNNPMGGRHIRWSTAVRSGNAKGNKATYTAKNGNEVPLPGVVLTKALFDAAGVPLTTQPQQAQIEHNGQIINAKVFPQLEGKKVCAAIQQYEDEYNGEVRTKIDIKDFFKCNNQEKKKKWEDFLKRNPVRKIRKKQEPQQQVSTDEIPI
jgi:hypothetical protein